MVLKQLNEIEKQTEDDNKSNFTIDLDLEKQVDLLLYEDNDLNDLNDAILENDKSNWSSTSNFLNSNFNNNQNEHNMTTPIPLSNNILNNQIRKTIESEDKLINNNILTPANSTIELSKKLLGHQKKDRNKNNEKELNISFLGEKFTDTFTGDSNTNITGNIIPNFSQGGVYLGQKNEVKEKETLLNMAESNPSSFDLHSNSVELNKIDLIRGFYYNQTPNNSIYYNSNYIRNNNRFSQFQQNYSQSQYLHNFSPNRNPLNKNNLNNINTFNNINNNINFSELSSTASVQSLKINNNKRFVNYSNNYNTINSNYRNKSYNNKLLLMLKDQKGSKFIQRKIEEKSSEFIYKLYEQIKNNLFDIMTDQYGNYVIQKLVENCDKKLISKILKKLSKNNNYKVLYDISINNYGTRPLQKMLDNLSSNMSQQDINILLNLSKGNVFNLIKDINGNRVIQSIILNIKNKELLTPIYKEMNDNIIDIIKTKSGCCVFAKVILNITENDLNSMMDIIINNLNQLINDEFGNICLKRLINLNNENFNDLIFNYIKDNILQLSSQKFSSNVIEACIDNTTSLKKKTIEKIIENENIINDLIFDQYGNYIIQNALQNTEQKEFDIIIKHIKENEKKLKQTQQGKIVFEKLMKNYRKFLVDNKEDKNNPKNYNNINDINRNKKQNNNNNIKKKKYNANKIKKK